MSQNSGGLRLQKKMAHPTVPAAGSALFGERYENIVQDNAKPVRGSWNFICVNAQDMYRNATNLVLQWRAFAIQPCSDPRIVIKWKLNLLPYLDVIRIRLFAFVTGGMTHQEGCVQKHLPGQALVRRRKIGRSHQRYDPDALETEEALITEVMRCPRPTHNDLVFEAGNVLPMGITIMPDFNGVLLYAAERSQHAKNKYPGRYYHQCRFQFLVDLKY